MVSSLWFGDNLIRRWLLRPSLWACIIGIVAYWDDQALHGSFVYDDAGSVKNNVVVTGAVPWTQAATRDFWGTPMVYPQSHKSFRPLTTLSFRLNWILSEKMGTNGTDNHTYGFHLVNVGLHGLVTGLVTESSGWVFDPTSGEGDITAQLLTGFIFALHPVHAEAVSNITSRGELLMSLFYLLAFLSYANYLPTTKHKEERASPKSIFFIYIVPWICMTLPLFCKEQGASALITLVAWDFISHQSSLRQLFSKLKERENTAMRFIRRTAILAMETLAVVVLRYWLNGESSPDFIYDQNPAAFSEDRFTRVFSVSWVYCLYVWDAIYPRHLCPDWSGKSIDLIREKSDPRILLVLALWVFAATCLGSLFAGLPSCASAKVRDIRRTILLAFFAFLFSPFLLSSNLLVVVGLMKADRVIYLPLMGFCIMEALFFRYAFCAGRNKASSYCLPGSRIHVAGYLLVLIQMFLFAAKVHERNIAWSHSLNLWRHAYEINPRSHHTLYNCGYELSLKKRYAEAEQVLRPISDPHVDGPSNTFVYAMVLYNLGRCEESLMLVEEALAVVEERRREGGVRNSDDKLRRTKSNLLVAKAYCTKDMTKAGQLMYDAVQADMTNRYAIEQAEGMLKRVQATKLLMANRS